MANQCQIMAMAFRGLKVNDRRVAVVAAGVLLFSFIGHGDGFWNEYRDPISATAVESATSSASGPAVARYEMPSDEGHVTRIEPATIVRFPDSSIACTSKTSLQRAMTYAANGQRSKLRSMIAGKQKPEGECIMLDPDIRFKVIAAEYPEPEIPEMGLLEIVGETSTSKHGSWAFSLMAEAADSST